MSSENDAFPKIYLLPNLMTAGNLFCGFAATREILKGTLLREGGDVAAGNFHLAILFILGACIFDLLDGRLARMGGNESEFGREFDSLADIISFGIAPALLIHAIVLKDFSYGWLISFFYLLLGAMRLARFNCIAAKGGGADKDFRGIPIPAAAGVIASVTLFCLWLESGERQLGVSRYILLGLMIFVSFMMFSRFRYPSFKALNWKTKKSIPGFVVILFLLVFTVMHYEWMPAVLFISYLLYGFFRPFLSGRIRAGLGDGEDEEVTEEKE